jgi:hypothetical protein
MRKFEICPSFKAIFCRPEPNPNRSIRNFSIATVFQFHRTVPGCKTRPGTPGRRSAVRRPRRERVSLRWRTQPHSAAEPLSNPSAPPRALRLSPPTSRRTGAANPEHSHPPARSRYTENTSGSAPSLVRMCCAMTLYAAFINCAVSSPTCTSVAWRTPHSRSSDLGASVISRRRVSSGPQS